MNGAFEQAFAVVVGHEGGYDTAPGDPGNWTGGRAGAGELRGTKYGISAASFPDLRIAELTLDDAREIYGRLYWGPIRGDELPTPLALLVFDAAVNNGPARAARWLQSCVGVAIDGEIGPQTVAAVGKAVATTGSDTLCGQYLAARLTFMAALPTWQLFGNGWSRRLCALAYQSLSYTRAPSA